MDRPITNKTAQWRKKGITAVVVLGVLALLYSFYSSAGKPSSFKADKDKISISKVEMKEFQEFIPADGVVVPLKTVVLDALESGVVREKFVEDGTQVTEGQPLLRLDNTDLQLDLLNKEAQVLDLLNNIRNSRNTLEQNKTNRLTQLADAEFQLAEAQRAMKNSEKLYKDKVISEQEYLQTKNNYEYQNKRLKLLQKALVQDSVSTADQITQMTASVSRMQQHLELVRKKNEGLTIVAPVAGQLSNFDSEIGETKAKGQNIASIDVSKGFKVRANIDELYIARTYVGQYAFCEWDGKEYRLEVLKIYPQVTNGLFAIDLKFSEDAPETLKRGQNISLKLQMSAKTQSLVIERGGFYQKTGGAWIFVLADNGKTAEKRAIKVGRQNPQYFEILEGLKVGEQVIISSYENFGEKTVLEF
ncbi:MAG: efflux RND transporter periplasmic adaptor subunit [Bacteroidota bacterium]